MAESTDNSSDGYSDMPLNTRQQNAIQVIKMWNPVEQQHIKCIQTAITVIRNALYKPRQEKYHKLRLSKPKVKKVIVDVNGGVKLLKLAGFSQSTDKETNEKILCIEPPSTMEEFEQLTDIWLVLLKTQYNWGINPDTNVPKDTPLPKKFQLPNTIKYQMETFFQTNDVAKSTEFQEFVRKSNDANFSPHAQQRYNYFAQAIKMLLTADKNFLNIETQHGLDDIDASDIAALITSEILCGYYDEDEAYTNLILAEDLRIMAQQQKEIAQQYQIGSAMNSANENEIIIQTNDNNTLDIDEKKNNDENVEISYKKDDNILFEMKDEELNGTIRWIGASDKWDKGLWIGVELDSENVVYGHNGYFNQERFFGCADGYGIYIREKQIMKIIQVDEMKNNKINVDDDGYKVIDIGCGWGNFGRLLMDKNIRPYMNEIEKESKLKKVKLYGFDISEGMIGIGKDNKFDEYYENMDVFDCKKNELKQFNDGTVDVVVSVNCIMQDKKIGHPTENFLIEVNRLLKVGGWFLVTRRFNGVHLGIQLYVYIMIAQQLGWKNVFASRVREIFYIGWKKMENPVNK
eukprot:3376_1